VNSLTKVLVFSPEGIKKRRAATCDRPRTAGPTVVGHCTVTWVILDRELFVLLHLLQITGWVCVVQGNNGVVICADTK
jgi:hypothetical protein